MNAEPGIKLRFDALSPLVDERARRLLVAAESAALGPRGVSAVARATGVSRRVIRQGMAELKQPSQVEPGRVRRAGGGRKKASDLDPSFRTDLEKLLESTTRGDPEAPLRWTCKSVRNLTAELNRGHHAVSHQVVADLLHEMAQSLQANRNTTDGAAHPDRNAQFEHLNGKVRRSLSRKQPVISVDTKKEEMVGDFKNGARELRPKGKPEPVRVDDFIDKEISADSGGSNGSRLRLWKLELQKLANETGLGIAVCHFPGTSKWNKIEHRLFSFITQNWRSTSDGRSPR